VGTVNLTLIMLSFTICKGEKKLIVIFHSRSILVPHWV
jgi:hypothetical protein